MLNLNIAYSATWQGIAIESLGYPQTMLIDAVIGLACLALLPWMKSVRGNEPDGGAAVRARVAAVLLGLGCLAWLPYRVNQAALGAAGPIFETVFSVIFIASALFLLAGAVVLGRSVRALTRAGTWLAPLLVLMFARRWIDAVAGWLGFTGRPNAFADGAELVLRVVPTAGGVLLLVLAMHAWRELQPQPA